MYINVSKYNYVRTKDIYTIKTGVYTTSGQVYTCKFRVVSWQLRCCIYACRVGGCAIPGGFVMRGFFAGRSSGICRGFAGFTVHVYICGYTAGGLARYSYFWLSVGLRLCVQKINK